MSIWVSEPRYVILLAVSVVISGGCLSRDRGVYTPCHSLDRALRIPPSPIRYHAAS